MISVIPHCGGLQVRYSHTMTTTLNMAPSLFNPLMAAFLVVHIAAGCAHEPPQQPAPGSQPNTPLALNTTAQPGLLSIETGYTISKVRTALKDGEPYIVASSYEGCVLCIKQDGTLIWKNVLSGCMNRDLWCADVTGNGSDEILAANADGSLYCLSAHGNLLWTFKPSDAPMSAVCAVPGTNGTPYVVCGGYELRLHYLDAKGTLVRTIDSGAYAKENPWGKDAKRRPPPNKHAVNFLRPLKRANKPAALAVHGALWSNSGRGGLYCFEPLSEKPYTYIKPEAGVGELRTADIDGDGNDEILTGASSMIQDAVMTLIDPDSDDGGGQFEVSSLRRKIDGFGYRVLQPELVGTGDSMQLFLLFGSRIILLPTAQDLDSRPGGGPPDSSMRPWSAAGLRRIRTDLDVDPKRAEVLANRFAYNDMWKIPTENSIVLASAQSGGSCVHILDLDTPGWKESYANLTPPGKITDILTTSAAMREQLKSFQRPEWENKTPPVYFLTDSRRSGAAPYIKEIESKYDSPIFLESKHLPRVEDVDRSTFDEVYQKRRDGRKKYVLTSEQMVNEIVPLFEGAPGISYWGGHGNDPFQTSLETQTKVFDIAMAKGKKVVTIYPEMEHYDEHFAWVMENHIYPMAKHAQKTGVKIFVRTKHAFWHSIVHMPLWHGLLSGELADAFVPALEETTDKTMEQSVAARLGIWTSGCVNQWGARCARDNTSFDRLRQHSHQMLPNHFLRQMIYNISCGATYLNNFPVDQDYMSVLWELIAKGALYVPQRNELVSLSPVHISMLEPDKHFVDTGNNVKWVTFFDQKEEDANPLVFGRLNGSWPGAPNTEWDYSRYAAGVTDRRLNYLPPFENGIVMLTPPQAGTFADTDAPRGKMVDHLHPLYRTIMKEYITDGRDYISADGKHRRPAKEYYKTIEADIKAGSRKLPLTVTGDVAWVCAQTSPTHLRLTLIDGGYINPSAKVATVTFHTAKPAKMTDLLDGTDFRIIKSKTTVDIPCGHFRFIDIRLKRPL